jgi:hypothetical protein
MNYDANDWIIIKILLQSIAEEATENKRMALENNTVVSTNLIDPDKITQFISVVDSELGIG